VERIKVSVDDGYRKWAAGYDAYPNALIVLEEPLVRGLLGNLRQKRVLDAGCGTGRHAVRMHAEGALVTAIDPNPAMLDIARAKHPGIDWRAGALTSLGVGTAAFDVALCALVLEHLDDLGPPLRELHRALAPGGTLVLSVFHPWFLLKGVPPHFSFPADGVEYELPAHLHLPSTYFAHMHALEMELLDMLEPIVDDALIDRVPNMEKHRGAPLALIFRARKKG
jgi:SAM-dependent methyltransferase